MAFSEHLRAHQSVKLSLAEIKKSFLKDSATRRGITIDACKPQVRELLPQDSFQLFSAFSKIVNVFSGTTGTGRGNDTTIVAIVADYELLAAMVGQRDITVATLNRFSAGTTKHKARVTTPVEKNYRLFSARPRVVDCL